MAEVDLDDIKRRMGGALDALDREFNGLRTGRASANLLEPLTVEAYGSQMPMIEGKDPVSAKVGLVTKPTRA